MSILTPSAKCIVNFAGQMPLIIQINPALQIKLVVSGMCLLGLIRVYRNSGSVSTSGGFGKRISGKAGHIFDPI